MRPGAAIAPLLLLPLLAASAAAALAGAAEPAPPHLLRAWAGWEVGPGAAADLVRLPGGAAARSSPEACARLLERAPAASHASLSPAGTCALYGPARAGAYPWEAAPPASAFAPSELAAAISKYADAGLPASPLVLPPSRPADALGPGACAARGRVACAAVPTGPTLPIGAVRLVARDAAALDACRQAAWEAGARYYGLEGGGGAADGGGGAVACLVLGRELALLAGERALPERPRDADGRCPAGTVDLHDRLAPGLDACGRCPGEAGAGGACPLAAPRAVAAWDGTGALYVRVAAASCFRDAACPNGTAHVCSWAEGCVPDRPAGDRFPWWPAGLPPPGAEPPEPSGDEYREHAPGAFTAVACARPGGAPPQACYDGYAADRAFVCDGARGCAAVGAPLASPPDFNFRAPSAGAVGALAAPIPRAARLAPCVDGYDGSERTCALACPAARAGDPRGLPGAPWSTVEACPDPSEGRYECAEGGDGGCRRTSRRAHAVAPARLPPPVPTSSAPGAPPSSPALVNATGAYYAARVLGADGAAREALVAGRCFGAPFAEDCPGAPAASACGADGRCAPAGEVAPAEGGEGASNPGEPCLVLDPATGPRVETCHAACLVARAGRYGSTRELVECPRGDGVRYGCGPEGCVALERLEGGPVAPDRAAARAAASAAGAAAAAPLACPVLTANGTVTGYQECPEATGYRFQCVNYGCARLEPTVDLTPRYAPLACSGDGDGDGRFAAAFRDACGRCDGRGADRCGRCPGAAADAVDPACAWPANTAFVLADAVAAASDAWLVGNVSSVASPVPSLSIYVASRVPVGARSLAVLAFVAAPNDTVAAMKRLNARPPTAVASSFRVLNVDCNGQIAGSSACESGDSSAAATVVTSRTSAASGAVDLALTVLASVAAGFAAVGAAAFGVAYARAGGAARGEPLVDDGAPS